MKAPSRHPSDRRSRVSGNALIEFALLLPFLLVLVLGMVDLSFLLGRKLTLTHLSREAASGLSRGSTFDETFAAVLAADGDLALDGPSGRVILTTVTADAGGATAITRQERRGGLGASSAVGFLGTGQSSAPATIPNGAALPAGMTLSVVEVFSQQPLVAGPFIGGPGAGGTLVLRSLAAF
jgi:Flp pilus assembly protein TadG